MRALKLYGPRDLRIAEEPMPQPRAGQVLLRVRSVTICHSDLHWYEYGRIGDTVSDQPLVLGHEFCGQVVEVAQGVGAVKPGDLVAVDPATSCGHCRYCREGNPNLCLNLLFAGIPPTDGALQEYMTYRAGFLHPLPPSFSADDGAVLEPLGVAIHAWDLARLRVGETVAIVGCGPIGLLLVQLARIGGASRVLAVESLAYRRDLAAALPTTTWWPRPLSTPGDGAWTWPSRLPAAWPPRRRQPGWSSEGARWCSSAFRPRTDW